MANPEIATMTDTRGGAEPVLRLERTFAAPRAAVFRAWTEPEQLVKWWGPRDYTVPVCEIDLRRGGAFRICMRGTDGGEHCMVGVYREILPPERLVFAFAWENDGAPGHETLVTVEFRDLGDETALTLTHEAFESADSRDAHGQGWSSSFDCLDDHLSEGARP